VETSDSAVLVRLRRCVDSHQEGVEPDRDPSGMDGVAGNESRLFLATEVQLSDRNTGVTSPSLSSGRDTFQTIKQNGRRRVVELTVDDGIPDIHNYVLSAVRIGGGGSDVVLYSC
jgi:hypothetical protein